MVESTDSMLPEPNDADAVAYMFAQMAQLEISADAAHPGDADDRLEE